MTDHDRTPAPATASTRAATLTLLVLTGVMLLALFSRTAPHPPLEVAPFALGPFLGASLAIGGAALHLASGPGGGGRAGRVLVLTFVVTALVSFGPQKLVDPAFRLIWPAVLTAQAAIVVVLVEAVRAGWRRGR